MSDDAGPSSDGLRLGNLSVLTTGTLGNKRSASVAPITVDGPKKQSVTFLEPETSPDSLGVSFEQLGPLGRYREDERKKSAIKRLFSMESDTDQQKGRRRSSAFSKNDPHGLGDSSRESKVSNNMNRLSMWGEELHDKLFAKKDLKEIMRKKLKLNLKDEGNNAPQIVQTDIENVVDYDEDDQHAIVKRRFVAGFIESRVFRIFILTMIIINSVCIGLQTNRELEKKWGYVFSALDQLILTIFIFEILIKWYGGFFTFWKVGWNVFDFIIVASSLIGPSFTFVSNSKVLKILRVLRAFRSLRSISALRPLQLVVQTIIQSLPDMANILLLLIIFMFIFAVIGVSFFDDASPKFFGNLHTAMFSLFVCITLDGWMEIFNSVKHSEYTVACAYFVIFILVGAFILINLVVAVVVTNLESAIAEQDELDLQQMQEEKGPDEEDNIRTFDVKDALNKKFWKHQKPIEVPNLPALNPYKVQNYMILVTALEDNYSEMVFLKEELSKIAKEVWDWNSPVDDEDEEKVAPDRKLSDAKVTEKQSTKEKIPTFGGLLRKASIATSADIELPKPSHGKKKSIISTVYKPMTVLEEADEVRRIGEDSTTAITEEEPAAYLSTSEETSEDEDDYSSKYSPIDVYADMQKITQPPSRAQVIAERKASLLAEIDRRDKGGDVLTDLIRMNKKTKNFSGKSHNMSQFVHGVDWLRDKVKGKTEETERKKKWQVETGQDKEHHNSVPLNVKQSRSGSITTNSENLINAQLSYIGANRRGGGFGDEEMETLTSEVNTERRNSILDMKNDIDRMFSKTKTNQLAKDEKDDRNTESPGRAEVVRTIFTSTASIGRAEESPRRAEESPGRAEKSPGRAEVVPIFTPSETAVEEDNTLTRVEDI